DTVSDFLPQYDQSVAIGARVGDEMSNWAMLNYGDRRNIDTVAGILMPYWYFWSRMPVRVAATGLQKPSLINKVYEIMRGIELENQQSGVPARMEGTLPLPQLAGSEPGTAYRINVSNLFRYIIPNYMEPNPYVDPESPRSEERRVGKRGKC